MKAFQDEGATRRQEVPLTRNRDTDFPLSLVGFSCPSWSRWDHSIHPSLISKPQSSSPQEVGNQSLEFRNVALTSLAPPLERSGAGHKVKLQGGGW